MRSAAPWTKLVSWLLVASSPFWAPRASEAGESGEAAAEVARLVQEAHRDHDLAAMTSLAASADPDPWRVLDALLSRGWGDAAGALALASPGSMPGLLGEYVAAAAEGSADHAAYRAVAAATHALDAGDGAAARAALGELGAATAKALSLPGLFRAAELLALTDASVPAARAFARTADAARDARWPRGEAQALALGAAAADRGSEYALVLSLSSRLLDVAERLHDAPLHTRVLANLGAAHGALGDLGPAQSFLDRALAALAEGDDPSTRAAVLQNLAEVQARLGDSGRAIATQEKAVELLRARGSPAEVAEASAHLGSIHGLVGNDERAVELLGEALKSQEEAGDATGAVLTRASLAAVLWQRGDFPKALSMAREARAGMETPELEEFAPTADLNVALTLFKLGDTEGGEASARAAMARFEERRDAHGVASARGVLAAGLLVRRDYTGALEELRASVEGAERLGDQDLVCEDWADIASCELALGRHRDAMASARKSIRAMYRIVRGLATEEGAFARSTRSRAFDVGAAAARHLGDETSLAWFLESGRAGELLESLGGREALLDARIPPDLAAARRAAVVAEASATAAYEAAASEGDRDTVRELIRVVEAARAEVSRTTARIQREAKAAASVSYPVPDGLATIQSRLGEDEAFVLYSLPDEGAFALVVRRSGTFVASLGPTSDVTSAAEGLLEDLMTPQVTSRASALREKVARPLNLPPSVRRVMVSPDGALSYVPFALLLPDREVVMEASATSHGLLRADAAGHGTEVLALGDPEYPEMRLRRLFETRGEAEAVGTRVLVGPDATETSFRAAVERQPWRSVLLACHGKVDPERPMLSHLALTGTPQDDGRLTALDVFRMRIPADLVFLAACETGRGRIVRGEGIVGLTRAFTFAGAPRVIVSLWEVDSAPTNLLVRRFYELWNPRDGSKPLTAARALREAQRFVRDFTEGKDGPEGARTRPWASPRYWAAWELWGLGD